MSKIDLKNLTALELEEILKIPKFRANQIFHWIHKKHLNNFDGMINLPIDLRNNLKQNFIIGNVAIVKTRKSKDGTLKYLLELNDNNLIECVFLKDSKERTTFCVSSQVGCPLNCVFCATGKLGLVRDLTVSEIISQVYLKEVNNVVFMGMGEPLLNYDNVLRSIYILNSKEGINIGARKITISTAGIPDGIRKLAEENIQIRLAVSLNAAKDDLRTYLMPINKKYTLKDLKSAILDYQNKSSRRVTLEYILLKNLNDSLEDAKALVEFCRGIKANVNLIPYNTHAGLFNKSPEDRFVKFIAFLKGHKIEAVKRVSRGYDIEAACGQLAG